MTALAEVVGRIEPECSCSCHDIQDGWWCGHCCNPDHGCPCVRGGECAWEWNGT
ncbi:hypothetical protein [Gordonia sp. ABSL49_1]|uniref:hypothetical protein n=1 Tax=Gordonia sp. ABSL49_1 TaxID=2920941 RepID=UPI001F0CEEC2|nr:hypothetical protein [Gordonia sp. ABSL49_1]MCH5645135.1 hypothetical protein [Gordonia sp. ABSL49_1]